MKLESSTIDHQPINSVYELRSILLSNNTGVSRTPGAGIIQKHEKFQFFQKKND